MCKSIRFLIVGMLLLALTSLPAAAAEDARPIDAVIIMDSSGSMKKTDPHSLRKPAAKLFISLLSDTDRVSVMSFSDNGYPITFLTPLDTKENREKSIAATDKVSSKGMYTNIYAAVERGLRILMEESDIQHRPMLVLLSDGQMDVGNAEKSEQLKRDIFINLVPQLQQLGVKVYSIAFTDASDKTLLKEISETTDGYFAVAATDRDLHLVFTRIFEQSKAPEMLPLTENRFLVDKSIKEITIVASKAGADTQIFLEPPGGVRLSSRNQGENTQWFESSSFDMITLTAPKEGEWKILFSDDKNKAYIVTDLELKTQMNYLQNTPRPELVIDAWLEQDKTIIIRDEILDSLELSMEVEHPDGYVEQLKPQRLSPIPADDAGKFAAHFLPPISGTYSATIIAKTQTFERQQVFSFRAHVPEHLPAEPAAATTSPSETTPAKPSPAPLAPQQSSEPEENDLMASLVAFGLVNLALAIIGIVIYLMIQRKKAQSSRPATKEK